MGNSHSQQSQQQVDVVRRPPTRPEAPPSCRPVSQLGPNGPSYHSPENLVLPKEIPVMKLRPVSMELSKYNPEYQDIYGYKNQEEVENEQIEDTNEVVENLSKSPARPPPPLQNGHISNSTLDKDRPVSHVSPVPNGILKTEPKKVKISENITYKPTHRRQMSASGSSNLTGQEHIIFEEPEESFDMRGKIDPLYQSYPGVSLPVKNNFNLDYSYQLTYVQLAEHRRQKTMEELEKRTGKKLSELSSDLNDNVEKPVFMRDEYSRVSTRSTGSTGSGLTNKKKKAPPPPSQPPPAPPNPPSKSGVPIQKSKTQEYSPENEPIPDYDLSESPRRQFVLPRYTVAPMPKNIPPPPPPQPNFSKPQKKEISVKRTNSMQDGRPEIILKKTPSINTAKTPENPSGHIPWLLEMKNLSEAKAARRQISQDSTEIEPPLVDSKETDSEMSTVKKDIPLNSSHTKLIFESSDRDFKAQKPDLTDAKTDTEQEEIFALEELDKSIGEVNNNETVTKEIHQERKGSLPYEKPASPKLARHHSSTVFDRKSEPSYERSNSSPGDPVRRLNSLLQHDIKVTAQAKCHKLVKQTTPVPPKPKDPHEVFREQLAKACNAREERVKVEGTIDEQLKTSGSDANLGRVLDDDIKEDTQIERSPVSNDSDKNEMERKNSSSEPPEVKPKPRYHKNVTMNKINNGQPAWKQKSNSRSSKANDFEPPHKAAVASFDWTPEDDLDSDDNLSDREEISTRKGASDGFKSSIIPSTVSDLKSKKQKEPKYKKKAPEPSEAEQANKSKFGSVKKLKKSVHKGMRNAFGSISKASGKLLRKQKTEEVQTVDDVPKNWKFQITPEMKRSKSLDNYTKYRMSNGYAVSDSEYDDQSETESREFDGHNGDVNSEDETSDEGIAEQIAQNIKRAGIAYVNDKGELVVLPDEKTAENDNKDVKHDKKKKRNKKHAKAAESLREKERKIEEERRKQLELELEMHKIREAETRERLQRLEAAQLQQQINAQLLQQQQQQNYTMLSAPPLPPAGVLPQNYSNRTDAQQTAGFPNLYNQQIPQNPYLSNPGLYSQSSGTLINGSVPNLSYNLDEYMRMLGIQNPPTSQQMAYFLNNMTWTGMNGLNGFPQPSERKSNPTLYDILHPEPVKQPCSLQAVDPSANKYGVWTSSPNLNNEHTNEPKDTVINDFVASYQSSGAKELDRQASKSRNPLYSSDDSDSGLSPSRTMARAQVQDFRPYPVVRTESGKFMKKYSSPLRNFEDPKLDPDFDLPHDRVTEITLRQRGGSGSVSPTNSLSTNDSTAVSTSDTPSSPGKSSSSQYSPAIATKIYGPTGFKTVVDLSKGSGTNSQVTVIAIDHDTTSYDRDLPLCFDGQDDPSKSYRM